MSNFGQEADPAARKLLNALVAAGLVDEVVDFAPRTYDVKEKKRLVSPRATGWVAAPLGCGNDGPRQADTEPTAASSP